MFRRTAADRKAEAARYRERTEHAQAQNPELPTVRLDLCEFDKQRGILKLASEYMGMPPQFFVHSHHTGKDVRFVAVGPEDILFDQDGWDGEQQIYRPVGNVPNVDHLVIYNQY
jgi:hypothetical protein